MAYLVGMSSAFSPSSVAFSRSLGSKNAHQPRISTQQNMFGGGASPLAEDDDDYSDEEQANIDAAAKQLGFSAGEYKLVLKMQKTLGDSVDALRVTGGDEATGVTITMDGNSPPKFLEVAISEDGKNSGKTSLEKSIIKALKDANEEAKKGQQAAVQKMNTEIAEEMKKMA